MASIIGFFHGNMLRAASFEGLLIKDKDTKHWQLKHGVTEMPFPDTFELFNNAYITVHILCVASSHIPVNMTTEKIIHEYSNKVSIHKRGRIVVRKSGPNTHSVDFDGSLHRSKDGHWGLIDPGNSPMPLGAAMNQTECRLVEIAVEQIYGAMPSILDCNRQVLYP